MSDAFLRRGNAAAEAGRHRAALAAFERAVRVAPQNPHAQAALAAGLVAVGRPRQAREHAEAAVRLRRRRIEYRLLLGDVLARTGDVEAARREYRRIVRMAPRDRRARARLASLRR